MSGVSVIIPTLNRAQKVVRAVVSVFEQTYDDFEIIVVDDGSDDGTIEKLEQFGNRIRCLVNSKTLGVSAARNRAIKVSEAPLIAFLDSDDYWLPQKLKVQTDFFRSNPEAVACQTDEVWIRKGRRVNPMKKHAKPSGNIFEASLKLCLVSPSAVMLKRSLLDRVGVFDEEFQVCEDYDLWLRISCLHPVWLIRDKFAVKTGGHADQLSSSINGMDRFRIKSMLKLLDLGCLNRTQVRAVEKELGKKCRIYGMGCLKRGKVEEGEYYLQLPEKRSAKTSLKGDSGRSNNYIR